MTEVILFFCDKFPAEAKLFNICLDQLTLLWEI
jgi:hypothetical protein